MRTMVLVGLMAVSASAASAQNTLEAAKDLYASAAYEEALTTLSRVGESAAGATARSTCAACVTKPASLGELNRERSLRDFPSSYGDVKA